MIICLAVAFYLIRILASSAVMLSCNPAESKFSNCRDVLSTISEIMSGVYDVYELNKY